MMNAITSYFDLLDGYAERRARATGIPARPPVLPQYLALAAGVVAEPFIHNFMTNQGAPVDWRMLGLRLLFGLLVALIIFPGVYRNAFDPERPIFVQLCAVFASGIGWQSLFQAATAAAGAWH